MPNLKQEDYNSEVFDWFNGNNPDEPHFSGILNIQVTKKPQPFAPHMVNVIVPANAKVKKVTLNCSVYEPNLEERRDITQEELDQTILNVKTIQIKGKSDKCITHHAPNNKNFTVKDLVKAIEKTELLTRGDDSAEWFGGIDVHHIFFEGLTYEDGYFDIHWGS